MSKNLQFFQHNFGDSINSQRRNVDEQVMKNVGAISILGGPSNIKLCEM